MGDKMTIQEFINNVELGGFIDYDGYGYYATEDKETDIVVKPSHVFDGTLQRQYSHVVWYNR